MNRVRMLSLFLSLFFAFLYINFMGKYNGRVMKEAINKSKMKNKLSFSYVCLSFCPFVYVLYI